MFIVFFKYWITALIKKNAFKTIIVINNIQITAEILYYLYKYYIKN